jgi:predicted AAA+ superfamily ATPase
MERFASAYLKKWKQESNPKPMIIQGARQVGKTWLMQKFGNDYYAKTAYVNFESSPELRNLFSGDFNVSRIIKALEIACNQKITKGDTLIILDEVQEAEGGITALKYFYENAPGLHILAAGSLLGVLLHRSTSFPVGKVTFFHLHPLSFNEFLLATGNEGLFDLLQNKDWDLIKNFKSKYITLLRQYYFTGGMPEAVLSFIENEDFEKVRGIQKDILAAYEQDFSKHAPYNIVPRIRMLWNSIPAQLAKENKKFIFSAVKKSSRAKDFELAISWLENSGLVYKVYRINKAAFPLKSYLDLNAFKLFINDVGLLAAMSDLPARTLLDSNRVFEEFKGALTEQYVHQQLMASGTEHIFYWSADKSKAEIDFIIQNGEEIIPIEVKAEENLKAKSLRVFYQKYGHSKPLRYSMSDYRKDDWLVNIPLYAAGTKP